MSSRILVVVDDDFKSQRKNSLARSILYWTERRGLKVEFITPSLIASGHVDYGNVVFAYRLLTAVSTNALLKLPKNIPLVVDIATAVKSKNNIFEGRRVAFRNAFGTSIEPWIAEQQVPLLPPPLALMKGIKRDVVIFDVKDFHDAGTHLLIASYLAEIAQSIDIIEKKLGIALKIYFTSFFDYTIYQKLLLTINESKSIKCSGEDIWSKIESRLIKPAADHEEYLNLLQRCRLLITEHGDIADADVGFALCLGLPVMLYKRLLFSQSCGFQSSVLGAMRHLNNNIDDLLKQANRYRVKEEWGLKNILSISNVPPLPFESCESIFMKSWDILHDWAASGKTDKDLNEKMQNGGWNKGLRLDNKAFQKTRSAVLSLGENLEFTIESLHHQGSFKEIIQLAQAHDPASWSSISQYRLGLAYQKTGEKKSAFKRFLDIFKKEPAFPNILKKIDATTTDVDGPKH